MSRYVVVGAGAIGGGVAGLLADADVDVVVVARGEHARAITERGLTVQTPERSFTVGVPCVTDPADVALTADDVLVLTVKTQQAVAALAQWADRPVLGGRSAGETLPILTALNGVSAESMALRVFARVIGVCVWMPAVRLVPGEVIIRGTPVPGTFHLGPVPAGDHEAALLDRIEQDWSAGGFQIVRPAEVMPWKYRKLISNIGNAFQALVGDHGDPSELITAAEAEARAVLAAAGITVVDDATEAAARADSFMIAPVPGEPAQLGGSSWQSLTRGTGDIETDYLNGEIVRLAHRHRVPAPINTVVARLARRAASSGARPGDLSADELARLLG